MIATMLVALFAAVALASAVTLADAVVRSRNAIRLLRGDLARIDSLRRAMDRYMVDKRLQLVAAPFEKWAGGRHELNYPIW